MGIHHMNLFAALGCCCMLYKSVRNGKLERRDLAPYLLIVLLTFILMMSELHAGRTFKGFVRVFVGLIMPLPMLYYRMYNPQKTIRVVINIFKLVSFIIVVTGIINLLFGRQLLVRYYTLANDRNYANMAALSLRLYSYIGHPLYNAELFLMTFGLNYAYNEIFKKNHKQDKWVIVLMMIGIAMTASKSAIALFLALLGMMYIRNFRYLIFGLTVLAVGYFKGIFDMVIKRFSASLTTGRSEVWERLRASGIDFFHFFWGNGSDNKYAYSYLEEWARAAFEYPYRLYALEFGILFTILIFIFLFILPEYKIIKSRANWILLSIVFGAVVAHVNMYNGIGTYSDPLYLYCLFGCVVLNIGTLAGEAGNNK